MAVSIKKNLLYSSILTVSNYLFPFLTYPYVSRVLGVTNIGICNFVDSIINYFILFSMMGIGIMGIREIAGAKTDSAKLNQVFSSLFLLNSITTAIALIAVVIAVYTVPQLYEHRQLMGIGVLKLLSNFFLIDWLYKGLENFKYVTKVAIGTKFLYVISIFLFVHTADDYAVYYLLSTLMLTASAVLNCIYARRFVHARFSDVSFKKYYRPFLILGVYLLLTSMYTSFNVAYLGFVSTPTEVGYYTTATKLYTIIIAFYTAFTGVMMPRMSALLSENRMDEFRLLIHKSVGILFSITIPAVILCCIFSPEIIQIISGKGYEGAIMPTRIVMPLLFIIGYEQVLVIQILMPLKQDKPIFVNSVIGACVGVVLNLLLVSRLASVGSSMVWVASEVCVLVIAQYFVHKRIRMGFPVRDFLKFLVAYIPACLICLAVYFYLPGYAFVRIGIAGILMLLYSVIIQKTYIKNELCLSLIDRFTRF